MIERTTDGFTYSGVENLNIKPTLYISNHRDIALDSLFLNFARYKEGMPTVRIAIGDNLLDSGFFEKIMKLNKSFVVHRNIKGAKETLKKLSNLSRYINYSLNEDKESFSKIPSTKKAISSLLLFYRMGLPSEHNRNRFINFDDKILRMTLLTKLESSKEGLKAISALNRKIKELQIHGQVTGKIPLFHELTPYVFKTFWKSFLLALAIISLILMVTLKSITLGLLALIPNLFPVLIGGSLYYLFDIQLDMGSALIASFCLGISVDDTIHFLFDYKKNAGSKKLKENFQHIMRHTFPPLFYTSMVLIAGFASFATANYIPNIKFGLMVAVILIIALFADFVILPCLLFFKNKHDHRINI